MNSQADSSGAGRDAGRPVGYSLITGGSGFIGTNLAHRLLSEGRPVLLLDNLARPGVARNLDWLRRSHGRRIRVQVADIRDAAAVRRAVRRADQVFHLAAQVAVTTSVMEPVPDFEINTVGTINLLEALRQLNNPPPLVFTSTNKVYGELHDIKLLERATRYAPRDATLREDGISERRNLDFHSPYGCSKGAADQYVIDYARTFKLPTVVFRMSCIYGPHQMGNEDQGWVAHFLISALRDQPVTLFGNGKQVRDILFIDDLVEAFLQAQRRMDQICGRAFNIGGGPVNTVSLLELLDRIESIHGRRLPVGSKPWRNGDQRYYVSDTGAFQQATGWRPRVCVDEGLARLYDWLTEAEHQYAAPLDGSRPVRAHRKPAGVNGSTAQKARRRTTAERPRQRVQSGDLRR